MRLKFLIIYMVCLSAAYKCFAGAGDYRVSTIPDSLLKDANAVVRNYNMQIDIVSLSEMYVTEKYAITILNEKAKDYTSLQKFYDKFIKIEKIKGTIYDKNGEEIQKIKNTDIQDQAEYSQVNFMDDARCKVYKVNYADYPFTCEFEIKTKFNTTFLLPVWMPRAMYDCAVENAGLQVSYPAAIGVKYYKAHIDTDPVIAKSDDADTLTFSMNNIRAGKKADYFTPVEAYPFPTVVINTNDFELSDKTGDNKSWKSFGKFFYDLNAGRDALPDDVKKTVHDLTDTCHNKSEKIAVLYSYLQKNTRYVSIQLGIGGWQTFDAAFVAEKGYGDCKALSYYMMALLKEAGITAYQAYVFAGETDRRPMITDYVHNQFNHVILCVPLASDTVWLECTSKTLPAGYLSEFTANRNALLSTPDGGVVIKTPTYNADANMLIRSTTMHVTDNEHVKCDAYLVYKGIYSDKEYHHVMEGGKAAIENYLNKKFSMPGSMIDKYNITTTRETYLPVLKEQLSLDGNANINFTEKRIFLSPCIMPISIEEPLSHASRKEPFQLHHALQISDTSVVILTNTNVTPEALPQPVNLSFAFANYTSTATIENNTIKIIRTYRQNEGIYPAEQFENYIRIWKAVNNSLDENKVVLLKKI